MNIKQIKYFISVAASGSLSAAAREHDISVQAMSKAMVDLEKNVAEPLFVRSHQGVTLTFFGREFLTKAEQVNSEFCELESFVRSCSEGESKIKALLCAPSFLRNGKACSGIESFIRTYLNINAEVSIGNGVQGMELLNSAAVDLLITIGLLNKEGLDCVVMGTVPTGVCLAKNHPLARKECATIEEVKKYPIVFSPSFDQFNESVLVTYMNAHDGFNIMRDTLNPIEAAKAFYLDHCVGLIANVSSLGEMLPYSTVVPIAEQDHIPVPLCFVTLEDRKTPAYTRIEQLFKAKQRKSPEQI